MVTSQLVIPLKARAACDVMSAKQVWRGIVCRCYGKRFVSSSWRIWMDVWCVVNGIKLTWLVDYLPLDATKLHQLLEDSRSAGIFTIQDHSLVILMLNNDLLVINTAILLARPPTVFIDVSSKLDKPVVVSECVWESVRCAIQVIHGAITAAKSCSDGQLLIVSQLTLTDEVNLCTIFGWLLGYPVVYWFDDGHSDSHDCVSMQHLVCYSVTASNAMVSY